MEESMLRQGAVLAVLVTFATVGSSIAQTKRQNDAPMAAVKLIEPMNGSSGLDPTSHEVPELQLVASRPADASLTSIARWLSTNFDLPESDELPRIEFVSAAHLAILRYKGLSPDQWRQGNVNDPAARADLQHEIVAAYSDLTKTIFLTEGWTGSTPAEESVLVHEMVHHLQNLGKLRYECPQAREKLAYDAQNEWLKLRKLELEKEFEVDMFTIIVRSACMN
jgi:hypothetical protein